MSGYDQFFKKAKSKNPGAAPTTTGPVRTEPPRKRTAAEHKAAAAKATSNENSLRSALRVKDTRTRKRAFPLMPFIAAVVALACAFLGYLRPDVVDEALGKIDIGFFTQSLASEDAGAQAKAAETKAAGTAENSTGKAGGPAAECVQMKGFSEEELSHFNKLNDRKTELDRREAELNLLEEELHKQKSEVEARILKLEQIRENVADVLKERVEMDQQRVTTLVDFYANMKPKQAAEIFKTLNEELAVEVLGRMKKKNAADILNLLEPAKARALSEKFTGYKRRG